MRSTAASHGLALADLDGEARSISSLPRRYGAPSTITIFHNLGRWHLRRADRHREPARDVPTSPCDLTARSA